MSDTRVITKDFDYFTPRSTEQAVSLLSKYRGRAKLIAGGTDLLVGIKMGRILPDCLINVKTIAGVEKLQESGDTLTIGAGCTFDQIESSRQIREQYQALYEAASSISSQQIKNMGTIGGNLCNASPAADSAPPLLALSARVTIQRFGAARQIPLEEFFIGPGETSMSEDEVLTEILLPILTPGTASAFFKIGRVSADLAKVNVAVSIKRNRTSCEDCRIALGSVAGTPFRVKKAEAMMKGEKFSEDLAERVAHKASEEISPITDVRSTQDYRREVCKVITRKALIHAWQRAERRRQG
jgi:CO/xanthine dehydrogenase FAD-binding subunit